MIAGLANGMLALLLVKLCFNDMFHVAGFTGKDNPGPRPELDDIIRRSGMQEFEYTWFPPSEEVPKRRVYPYTRQRDVNQYSIVLTRTASACTIKLYENLEGWKRKLRATWTGVEKTECDRKFEQITETVRQVIFEHKAGLKLR